MMVLGLACWMRSYSKGKNNDNDSGGWNTVDVQQQGEGRRAGLAWPPGSGPAQRRSAMVLRRLWGVIAARQEVGSRQQQRKDPAGADRGQQQPGGRTIVTSPGMSMDSTPFSRTRRAISCVYCSRGAQQESRQE